MRGDLLLVALLAGLLRGCLAHADLPRPWGKVSNISDPAGELWGYISVLEEEEYKARHILRKEEIAKLFPSCVARSICGLWMLSHPQGVGDAEEATGGKPGQCIDLCVDTRFLPAVSVGLRQEEEQEAALQLQKELWDRQFGSSAGGWEDWKVRAAASPMSGFGVTMVYAAHNLAKAFASGNLFSPANDALSLWTSHRYCGENRTFSCYFEPPTNHSIQILDSGSLPLSLPAEREQAVMGIDGIIHDFGLEKYERFGSFWFQSQMLNFLWRPNARTREYISRMTEGWEVKNPIIGLHVRRGDSFMAGRWMPTLERYLEEARILRDKYGVNRIFIATDDEDSAQQCTESKEFSCFSLPIGRSVYDVGARAAPEHNPQESAYDQWVERRIERGELDGSEVGLHVIAEITILSECDFFVGRLDSAISRLALMLMTSKRGPRPFVSLDKPWAQAPYALIN